jgi:hypothetical protein
MYVSLDEACTHVDAAAFRLVAGVYNRQGTRLLATAVSPPVRVLANNDVPTGAARITLDARLPADWEGWAEAPPAPADQDLPAVPSAPPTAAARPKRTRGDASRHPAHQPGSAEPSLSSVSASEEHPGGSGATTLPQSLSAPVGLAAPGAAPPPPAFSYQQPDHSSALQLPSHGADSQALLAAWHQQHALATSGGTPGRLDPVACGDRAGAATRTLSLLAAPQHQQLQSHWQLRQAAMHGGGGATPFAAAAVAAARAFSLPDPSLSLQPGGSGQWQQHPAMQPGSPRAASMPVGSQDFSFMAQQQAGAAAMLPRPPSAGSQQQQQQQQQQGFQQQVADWGQFSGPGGFGPAVAGGASLQQGSAQQQLAARYCLPQRGELMPVGSGGLGLPHAYSVQCMGAAGSGGSALPTGTDPAGVAAAAAADRLACGPAGSSLTPPQLLQQAAPLHRTSSDLLAGSAHSGSATRGVSGHLPFAPKAQREAARHAALLQHADAQMLAASRATASRAALHVPGGGDEAVAHLHLEARLQHLHLRMQQQQQQELQQRRQQLAAAMSAAGLQLPFEPGSLPALHARGSSGGAALFPSSLPLADASRGQDLSFPLPFPPGG